MSSETSLEDLIKKLTLSDKRDHVNVNAYRKKSICPTPEDIHRARSPNINPNQLIVPYESIHHYLSTQFELLREDLVSQLVECVQKYRQQGDGISEDIPIYHNIDVVGSQMLPGGIYAINVTFDFARLSHVDWSDTSRLLPGSLLCLSCDNFDTMFFATIAKPRDWKEPNQLCLEIFGSYANFYSSLCNRNFIAIESIVYFEGYRHALNALQEFGEKTFPMKRYIVEMVCENVDKPKYLEGNEKYNFLPIMAKSAPNNAEKLLGKVDIFDDVSWFKSRHDIGLDHAQAKAFSATLTKEFVVVQGPPGTGKSYMAIKIIQTLLANKSYWKLPKQYRNYSGDVSNFERACPILILAFKNHALDHLLEKLYEDGCHNMVRVGHTESPVIKELLLQQLRFENNKLFAGERKAYYGSLKACAESIRRKGTAVQQVKSGLRLLGEEIISFMTPNQRNSLKSFSFDTSAAVAKWLGFGQCYVSNADSQKIVSKGKMILADLLKGTKVREATEQMRKAAKRLEKRMRRTRVLDQDVYADDDVHLNTDRYLPSAISNVGIDMLIKSGSLKDMELKKLRMIQGLEGLMRDKQQIMAYHVAMKITDVGSLNMAERWKLYSCWAHQYLDMKYEELDKLTSKLSDLREELNESNAERDYHLCKNASVIGMTITGEAKYKKLVEKLSPKHVIIEEAAEVLEPFLMSALTKSMEQVILIGDHKQLRPISSLDKKYKLDISLFERLVQNKMACYTLETQHRMRPEIASLLRPQIYEKLLDGPSVQTYPDVKDMRRKNLFFFNSSGKEGRWFHETSYVNKYEALFVLEMVKYFMIRGVDPEKITLLTTYNGQLNYLKRRMSYNKNFFMRKVRI